MLWVEPSFSLEIVPPIQQRDNESSPINFREAETYNNLGVELAQQGKTTDAIAAFERAIELYPDYENAYNNLGLAYASVGQFSEAANAFREAIAINPNNPENYSNLGSALGSNGQISEAAHAFEQAIALDPNNSISHYNLAFAFFSLGKIPEAIASLKKARELFAAQNNPEVVKEIDLILQELENANVP